MIKRAFKDWLQQKGIDFTDYTLMADNARHEINALYMRENVKLNERYKVKDLEERFPCICIEMTDVKRVKEQIVSGVLVNILPNAEMAEKRYWELILSGEDNWIVGIA